MDFCFIFFQDSWDAEEEETKKTETKVPEKKTKSKLEQKIAEREVLGVFIFYLSNVISLNNQKY